MKYWYKILKGWRDLNRRGLTIPYLIGSSTHFNIDDKINSIEGLIYDILESDVNVYITHCTDINALIIGIKDERWGNFSGEYLTYNSNLSTFYVSKIVKDSLTEFTPEALIIHLEDLYENEILHKRYSRIDNEKWDIFTENDKNFISKQI